MSNIVSIICFFLIIGLVIFFHEFGHFLLAKKNGVSVTEFSIGMGPELTSWIKNGTQFSLRLIPFGGYCLMLGQESFLPEQEEGEEKVETDEEHAYMNKPVGKRIAIIAAGPIFNFILALILALLLVALEGANTTVLGGISTGYPAEEAGLQAGDEIVKIDNTRVHLFQDISLYMTMHEGEELTITYLRDGKTYTTTLVPKYNEEESRYLIGIIASSIEDNMNIGRTLKYGYYTFRYNTGIVIKSLGMLFTGKFSLNDLSGPVGMASTVSDIVSEVEEDTKGESFFVTAYWVLINLLNFTVLISANLGVMNLLPIPGMDGGRLLFLLIELVRGKPIEKKKEGIVTMVGFVLLLLLMVVVFFNDIRKTFFMAK